MARDAQRGEERDGQERTEPQLEEFYENTGKYGTQNPEAPGEPDHDRQTVSTPVPNTGHGTRQEHKREHDRLSETPTERRDS